MTIPIPCDLCDGTGVLFGDVCRFCRPRGTFAALVDRFNEAKTRLGRPIELAAERHGKESKP